MKGDVVKLQLLSTYIFANVLKMSFPMDSTKGEHVVRLDKYFINFFGIATNEVTRGPVPRHKQTTENV